MNLKFWLRITRLWSLTIVLVTFLVLVSIWREWVAVLVFAMGRVRSANVVSQLVTTVILLGTMSAAKLAVLDVSILVVIEVALGWKGLVAVWEQALEWSLTGVDAHVRFQVVLFLSAITAAVKWAGECLFWHLSTFVQIIIAIN
jgi:hypothetical protein